LTKIVALSAFVLQLHHHHFCLVHSFTFVPRTTTISTKATSRIFSMSSAPRYSKCCRGHRSDHDNIRTTSSSKKIVDANNSSSSSSRTNKSSLGSIVLSLSICLLAILGSTSTPAHASDYGSLTPEQRFIAETWRTVDNVYIDRTFNHQNWFQLRQDALSKKYKNMDEARKEVESILNSLGDRYTRYLPPAKYESIVNAATGNLFGVGVELAQSSDGTRVIVSDVESNGPAAKGGLKPKDVFVEVDGVRFDDDKATPDDVALVVRGPEGSKVGVVVERDGKIVDFILTREPIKITSVRSYMGEKAGVSGKVGIIRIKNFSGTTAETVKSEITALKKKGATIFLLDLRGNPGGLLPGGVDTASLFLEANKPVVFVVDKKGIVDAQSTLADGIDVDSPLVLLVDGNTASAAEVFTAALKENHRAVVAGEQTFGKGIVQTIRQIGDEGNNNGGVAVTIARYETPAHHDINKQGIPVDVKSGVDCGDALSCLPREAFTMKI
jgi:carboxyl-terminal processing protease